MVTTFLRKHSKRLLRQPTATILTLCLSLVVIVLGCSAKKVPQTLPSANLPDQNQSTSCYHEDNPDDTTCYPLGKPTPNLNPAKPTQPNCGKLLPICAGLTEATLIRQDADIATLNTAMAKYQGKGCRFTQPPRCDTGEKQICPKECTP